MLLLNCSTSYSQIKSTISSTGESVASVTSEADSVIIAISDIRKANTIMIKSKYQDSIIYELERRIILDDIELTEYKTKYDNQIQIIKNYNDNVKYLNNKYNHIKYLGIGSTIIAFILGLIL